MTGTDSDSRAGAERSLCVVVVDDEADVAAYLAAVLERGGHRSHTASNAADGFSLVKELRPDVACLDIVMPGGSGVALYQRIRSDPEVGATPVVFITALTPEIASLGGLTEASIAPAPEEYLEKPASADEFLAAVLRAAGSREDA